MKIAVISDTHDNLATLDKFIAFSKKNGISIIIHCGDVQSKETLDRLAGGTKADLSLSLGNADDVSNLLKAAKNLPDRVRIFKGFGEMNIAGLKIGFCHLKDIARENCQKNKFDFVFYGHSHKPWKELINGCVLVNPGNLSGVFFKATFAVLDTQIKELSLKVLEHP